MDAADVVRPHDCCEKTCSKKPFKILPTSLSILAQ